MKKILQILIFFLFFQTHSLAGQYSDRFTNCLMEKTTDRDKIVLVRWVFSVIAQHSALSTEFQISSDKVRNHEIAVADYMQYILGTVCFQETKDVLNYEGVDAFGEAFELLGELAMLSLMEDQRVNVAFENWIKYLDPNFLKKFE